MQPIPIEDPTIKRLAAKHALPRLEVSGDPYFDLLDHIVSQQLSGRAATTIFNRFCVLYPNGYPHPKLLLATSSERLRGAGLSGPKSEYLKAVASFALSNEAVFDRLENLPDEEIIRLLTQIRGVGVWTVQMLLIFSLNRTDVFPSDDLAIRKGMQLLYELQSQGKSLKNEMMAISNKWKPHRTLATRLIWQFTSSLRTTRVTTSK